MPEITSIFKNPTQLTFFIKVNEGTSWSPTKNIHTCIQNTKHKTEQTTITKEKKTNYKKESVLSVRLDLPTFCFNKSENDNELHIIGTATKNECLNALIVELTRFIINGCDLVDRVFNQKYLEKSMAVLLHFYINC